MIERIDFKNFRILRDTAINLGPLNLLIGPNGSGKSTVLRSLRLAWDAAYANSVSAVARSSQQDVTVTYRFGRDLNGAALVSKMAVKGNRHAANPASAENRTLSLLQVSTVYELSASAICAPVKLQPEMKLDANGGKLAGVLDRLRDEHPERFEAINRDLPQWLPAFDRVLFVTPQEGMRAVALRTTSGLSIPAAELSEGTRHALAILTLAYLPDAPPIVCIEEPDKGLHPRLMREVRDALYRLAYPQEFGDERPPVQVIATTHSPYLVDLFKDNPQDITVCNLEGDNVRFTRLTDLPNYERIIDDASLGELWYSGILGGVPSSP